jgi:serine/threonine protein kinase
MLQTAVRRAANLDLNFVEETFDFVVHEDGTDESPQQFCVAVESPSQTLNRIVAGMLDNPDYERKPELRQRYMIKVCLVLRQVAKSLCHLHSSGVIHADLCLENCGKFGDKWKLASTMGIQNVGKSCDPSRLGESAPPEAIELVKGNPKSTTLTRPVALKSNLEAHPSMDIWAFGKLAYEALVGEPLLDFDTTLPPKDDIKALNDIMKWNKANLKEVVEDLIAVGIPKSGIDLITHCLMPQPHKRPATMDRILVHPFWKEIQRLNASSQKSTRSRSHRRS